MTQEAYTIWRPEYDGHAPPNWRKGMKWTLHEWQTLYGGVDPRWLVKNELYYVEPKALNSPNDDAKLPIWNGSQKYKIPIEALTAPNEDAKDVMPQDPRRSVQEALAILRGYSPEELAKHGITLAPEKDWATELWADLYEVRDMPEDAELVRSNQGFITDLEAIALIRERVVLKGEG